MLQRLVRYLVLLFGRLSGAHRFRPHARSPFPVATGRVGGVPEGCGTIRISSRMITRARQPRVRRPEPGEPLPPKGNEYQLLRWPGHFPVILIDGAPAATGRGRGRIAVPAGRHLVQVQAGASGRHWPVEVPEGGEVRLSSVVAEPFYSGVLSERMRRFYRCFRLGPRRLGRSVARFEPVGEDITWRPVDPDDLSEPDPGSGAILRIHVVFLYDSFHSIQPLEVRRTPLPEAPVAAQPIPGRRQDPDAPFVEVIGEELEGMGRWWKRERRALVRDMRWDHAAGERKAATVRRRGLPWVEPPRITLDDRELPAIWGLNEYRLPPGSHDLLEVAIPRPAPLLDKGTEVDLLGSSRLLFDLDLREGSVTEIEGYAQIKSTMNADGLTLTRYSGRIWTAEPPRNSP
ncbi:hypothetical protein [Glycomyces salinus]|uniref:hypothetical protein n=1 Tax=Glycomyces salinus TaxID=980294 RepID=UPI0018EB3FE7|nr:hypothetical protein [Glycomyces salinus]